MLSGQVRWNPFPRAPTLHPRALRGLASLRKVPGAAPFPNRPPGGTARPAPRFRVRKLRRGDFRLGRRSGRRSGCSEALLPLVPKPQVPPVVQPKPESGAPTSRRGGLGTQVAPPDRCEGVPAAAAPGRQMGASPPRLPTAQGRCLRTCPLASSCEPRVETPWAFQRSHSVIRRSHTQMSIKG